MAARKRCVSSFLLMTPRLFGVATPARQSTRMLALPLTSLTETISRITANAPLIAASHNLVLEIVVPKLRALGFRVCQEKLKKNTTGKVKER